MYACVLLQGCSLMVQKWECIHVYTYKIHVGVPTEHRMCIQPRLLFGMFHPSQGSVLGPEEFLEGLGIGLRSFVGGTVGT